MNNFFFNNPSGTTNSPSGIVVPGDGQNRTKSREVSREPSPAPENHFFSDLNRTAEASLRVPDQSIHVQTPQTIPSTTHSLQSRLSPIVDSPMQFTPTFQTLKSPLHNSGRSSNFGSPVTTPPHRTSPIFGAARSPILIEGSMQGLNSSSMKVTNMYDDYLHRLNKEEKESSISGFSPHMKSPIIQSPARSPCKSPIRLVEVDDDLPHRTRYPPQKPLSPVLASPQKSRSPLIISPNTKPTCPIPTLLPVPEFTNIYQSPVRSDDHVKEKDEQSDESDEERNDLKVEKRVLRTRAPVETTVKESSGPEVSPNSGPGVSIQEIPGTADSVNELSLDELSFLYLLMYGKKQADRNEMVSHILSFSGFPNHMVKKISKAKKDLIKKKAINQILSLSTALHHELKKGSKSDVVNKFFDFISCPSRSTDDGKAESKKSKSSSKKGKKDQDSDAATLVEKARRESKDSVAEVKKKTSIKAKILNVLTPMKSRKRKYESVEDGPSKTPELARKKRKEAGPQLSEEEIESATFGVLKKLDLEAVPLNKIYMMIHKKHGYIDLATAKPIIKSVVCKKLMEK